MPRDISMSKIDAKLKKLNKSKSLEKGDLGEEVVEEVIKDYMKTNKNDKVKYLSSVVIPQHPNNFTVGTTEIDGILLTPHRIICIEIKAYSGNVEGDERLGRPAIQTLKHCKHLYHNIYIELPEGSPDYIVPLLVYTAKAEVKRIEKVNTCILNNLIETLIKVDSPLEYTYDIDKVYKILSNTGISKAEHIENVERYRKLNGFN